MRKLMLAIVGILMFSPSAFAAGYGEAGCGLGSLIFGNTSGPVQILAATTNWSTYSQGFGITSGTSNCDAKGFDVSQLEQERFVTHNFSGLTKDMATGEGEHLSTLAGMLGCPSIKQAHFNTVAQQNYEAIYASDTTSPAEMLKAVKGVVARDKELAATCSH